MKKTKLLFVASSCTTDIALLVSSTFGTPVAIILLLNHEIKYVSKICTGSTSYIHFLPSVFNNVQHD